MGNYGELSEEQYRDWEEKVGTKGLVEATREQS